MKREQEPKKLTLKRERLRQLTQLGDHQLADVAGGTSEEGVLISRTCRNG